MRLSVLGVPIVVESNERTVAEMAREMHDDVSGRRRDESAMARIRIMVDEAITSGDLTPMSVTRSPPDRLSIRMSGAVAHADGDLRIATARVSPASLSRSGFRESILDHLALFLVTRADRVPIHAAGVTRGDTALLLAAASGVGKSSLSYAMIKAGFRLLADDAVYTQRNPTVRLWGVARAVHLSPTAVVHFPELADVVPSIRPDGRKKLAVPVPKEARAPVPWTGRSALVVLAPAGSGPPSARLTVEQATNAMRATAQGGFGRFEGDLESCVRAVSVDGCWRLSVDVEPWTLVRRVEALLA